MVGGGPRTLEPGPELRSWHGETHLCRLRQGAGHRRDHTGGDGYGAERAGAGRDVSDFEERVVGGLRIRIDRTLCVGFGDCVTEAPAALVLDDTGTAAVVAPQQGDRERVFR